MKNEARVQIKVIQRNQTIIILRFEGESERERVRELPFGGMGGRSIAEKILDRSCLNN